MWLFLLFSHCDVWLFVTYGLQHARLRHPPLFPGGCLNSCPLSQWCDLTILSFDTPFFCLQSFRASGSFPVNQLFAWGGQSIEVSASASVFPMNTEGWFPLGLTVLISLLSKGLKSLLQHNSKASILWCSALWSNIHTWLLAKSQFWLYECQQSDVFGFYTFKKITLAAVWQKNWKEERRDTGRPLTLYSSWGKDTGGLALWVGSGTKAGTALEVTSSHVSQGSMLRPHSSWLFFSKW